MESNLALYTLLTAYKVFRWQAQNYQTEAEKHWETIHCEYAKNVLLIKDCKSAKLEDKGLFCALGHIKVAHLTSLHLVAMPDFFAAPFFGE